MSEYCPVLVGVGRGCPMARSRNAAICALVTGWVGTVKRFRLGGASDGDSPLGDPFDVFFVSVPIIIGESSRPASAVGDLHHKPITGPRHNREGHVVPRDLFAGREGHAPTGRSGRWGRG